MKVISLQILKASMNWIWFKITISELHQHLPEATGLKQYVICTTSKCLLHVLFIWVTSGFTVYYIAWFSAVFLFPLSILGKRKLPTNYFTAYETGNEYDAWEWGRYLTPLVLRLEYYCENCISAMAADALEHWVARSSGAMVMCPWRMISTTHALCKLISEKSGNIYLCSLRTLQYVKGNSLWPTEAILQHHLGQHLLS